MVLLILKMYYQVGSTLECLSSRFKESVESGRKLEHPEKIQTYEMQTHKGQHRTDP